MVTGKTFTRREYESLASRFLSDFISQFQVGAVDNSLIVSSVRNAVDCGLRTADAIHFAIIQRTRESIAGTEDLYVVTSDTEMIEACKAENIEVLHPEADGVSKKLRRLRK